MFVCESEFDACVERCLCESGFVLMTNAAYSSRVRAYRELCFIGSGFALIANSAYRDQRSICARTLLIWLRVRDGRELCSYESGFDCSNSAYRGGSAVGELLPRTLLSLNADL